VYTSAVNVKVHRQQPAVLHKLLQPMEASRRAVVKPGFRHCGKYSTDSTLSGQWKHNVKEGGCTAHGVHISTASSVKVVKAPPINWIEMGVGVLHAGTRVIAQQHGLAGTLLQLSGIGRVAWNQVHYLWHMREIHDSAQDLNLLFKQPRQAIIDVPAGHLRIATAKQNAHVSCGVMQCFRRALLPRHTSPNTVGYGR
jgi:hypothetical protein